MEKLEIQNTIVINTTPEKIWEVLTQPEQTKKYMFGCETVSDWKPGSSLIWRMDYDGKDFVAVKGNILDIQPEKLLTYTVFDPNATMADIPENYLTVTYALTSADGQTNLTVTQGDYKTVAEGERRYQEAYNNGEGWNPILVQIKAVAESL
ncbi:SRPBCC domain-containing protein [Adhaeribacter soli]|uniref:Activator of Hsp90 ATPase homologue 1/2-like C-terminal domain-containing protein n=1 Tax=Adhaeribacter soli TaxID=2607655 RepID=A0A5N1IKP0_9BACT|nr:SRPBCC domain-containing protein [Adhaeribacter soli]KAA9325959.1 hypothetical protein F0P94_16170 [Adhaeribacter soli]